MHKDPGLPARRERPAAFEEETREEVAGVFRAAGEELQAGVLEARAERRLREDTGCRRGATGRRA